MSILLTRRLFQSTHPGWGATTSVILICHCGYYFNPRTPGGVRLMVQLLMYGIIQFQSTHPGWGATWIARLWQDYSRGFQSTHPGWGATLPYFFAFVKAFIFQSTHPGWGATKFAQIINSSGAISIHAPRVGCDNDGAYTNNYPSRFQSTHPGWGATEHTILRIGARNISIHAPRVGCDSQLSKYRYQRGRFQSTHPGWGATRIRDTG